MTIAHAADVLHISRSAAYRAARAGRLDTQVVGGRRLVPTLTLYQMIRQPPPGPPLKPELF